MAIGALCVLGFTFSFFLSKPHEPGQQRELSDARDAQSVLSCSSTSYLEDDVAFWDTMTGLNCFMTEGKAVFIRVYDISGSPNAVLQDWAEVLSPDRQIIATDKWFAVGPPEDLKKVSSEFVVEYGPSEKPPENVDITTRQARLGDCSLFLTSAVYDLALDSQKYENSISHYEAEYPGSKMLVESLASDSAIEEIKIRQKGLNMEIDEYLSRLSGEIKPFCEKSIPDNAG